MHAGALLPDELEEHEVPTEVCARRQNGREFVAEISKSMLSDSGSIEDVLHQVAGSIVHHFEAAFAQIWTFNDAHQILQLQATAGLHTLLNGANCGVPFGPTEVARIANERAPYVTNDVLMDPEVDRDWVIRMGLRAMACCRIVVGQRVVGLLVLFAGRTLSADLLEELAAVAELLPRYIERKRAHDLLQQSERRYRALIEHADGIISILAADGTIVYESPHVRRVLGYSDAERVGRSGFDLIHPAERERALKMFSTLVARPGETSVDAFRFRHADGSFSWLEVTGHNRLMDPAVFGVIVYFRDVSEHKLSEQEHQRSEERFRALIERSSDMITLHRADGTISYASPSMVRLLGYDAHELLDRNLLEHVHPDDQRDVVQGFTELLAEPGRSTVARYRIRHRDGSWRSIETTRTNLLHVPAIAAIVCNKRDVTAEVQAQQHLEQTVAERTQELSTLLEVSRGLGSTLELRRLIELIFDQLKIRLDYSAVGLHIAKEQGEYQMLDYRGPLPRQSMLLNGISPSIEALLRQAGATGRPVIVDDFDGDTPMMRRFQAERIQIPKKAYGHARAVLVTPLLSKGRHIGGLILLHRVRGYYTLHHAEYVMAFAQHAAVAIENARLYEALHEKAALEERQRLARELHDSVSQALYAIALNAAAATESLHKLDRRKAALQVRHVRQLARAGLAEMRALIFELRAESLAEEGLVVALGKQSVAVEVRHELKIRSAFTPEPPLSLIAKEALYRIAQEALHNVVKHARARRVDLTLEVEDNHVVLSVRDNGRGFEPGTGFPGHLGLRSMQERAQSVGGSFAIESARGVGTTVRVQVPVASV